MARKERELDAEAILTLVAGKNPYNRQGENKSNEYLIYQMGFLAAYLASLIREDPYIGVRLIKHIESIHTKNKP